MITLYTFGPAFRLPDPSPFVTKAEILLKLAGLEYRTDAGGFSRAPKGKLPFIDDAGKIVADSTLIRLHLENQHGIDFDPGLDRVQRATAWAVEKMLEDHVYWGVILERWMDKTNFDRGPRAFFDAAPAPVRPLVRVMVRRQLKRTLHGQGLGRHTPEETAELMRRAIHALSDLLGDKRYLMGDTPCGADATVFAFVAGILCPHFEGPIRRIADDRPNLAYYRDRCMTRWFPQYASASAP